MRAFRMLCGTAALIGLAQSANAQTVRGGSTDLITVVDGVFSPWNNTHGPGCAVGISKGGKVLLTRGYGMADIASERPITAATILESGSVAKQFTSMAVLLLMQDGKLKLDDDARVYLPELPKYDRVITVRNLLTHTSGLRDWGSLMAWQGWPRGTRVHTQSDILDVVSRQRAINYPVGEYYSYTNTGFLLLRTLVERVSGMSFSKFTNDRIFVPLGMTHTSWRDDFTRIVPGLAQAYAKQADGWHIDMPLDNVIAAGGLWTTVGDWLIWNEALSRKSLGQAVSDSITQQMKLNGGLQIQYALGLIVTKYRGLQEISHSGSTAGYTTYLARFPEQDNLSIAVMCNAAGAGAGAYTHAIVDAMVPGLPNAPVLDTVTMSAAALAEWRGVYRDTRTNITVKLDTMRAQLRRGNTVMHPLGDGVFAMGNTRLRMSMASRGSVKTAEMRQLTADGDSVLYVREAVDTWVPTTAELAALVGSYRTDELGMTYTVSLTDGKLRLQLRAGVSQPLVPTYKDAFQSNGIAVWFTRDGRGRITAMHFGSSRAWDFVSVRVP